MMNLVNRMLLIFVCWLFGCVGCLISFCSFVVSECLLFGVVSFLGCLFDSVRRIWLWIFGICVVSCFCVFGLVSFSDRLMCR